MGLEPLAAKWRAFGWNAVEVDGHDVPGLLAALGAARKETAQPTVLIAHTIKGKGVPFMEDQPAWHGSVKLTSMQCRDALNALDTAPNLITEYVDGQ
jgi:transketolase